jgi:hypothetical protein
MDRKHCILLYSNYSQASIDLLSYIKELPLDFPKVTGMTILCIDNEQFKDILQKNGIEYVPTLLVEYYQGSAMNQTKQKFERDHIYMWIDQVMKTLHFEWPQNPQTRDQSPEQRDENKTFPPSPPQEDVPIQQKKEKLDITSLAQQMAKDRDSYISETTPEHKKRH